MRTAPLWLLVALLLVALSGCPRTHAPAPPMPPAPAADAAPQPPAPTPPQPPATPRPLARPFLRGNVHVKAVALTFDDGPHPGSTSQLLAILRERHVKATFFVVGNMAERYPDLVRAEVTAGQLVANHTYSHPNLAKLRLSEVAEELSWCNEALQRLTGTTPQFFRPPYLSYNREIGAEGAKLGLRPVLYTDDTGDLHRASAAVLEAHVLSRACNGDIMVFHDGSPLTLKALPTIIDRLREQGFQFQTLAELEAGGG